MAQMQTTRAFSVSLMVQKRLVACSYHFTPCEAHSTACPGDIPSSCFRTLAFPDYVCCPLKPKGSCFRPMGRMDTQTAEMHMRSLVAQGGAINTTSCISKIQFICQNMVTFLQKVDPIIPNSLWGQIFIRKKFSEIIKSLLL